MPSLNRKGPEGKGPMTGRKQGRCNPHADKTGEIDQEPTPGKGLGRGRGQGQGKTNKPKGRGMSRGRGKGKKSEGRKP